MPWNFAGQLEIEGPVEPRERIYVFSLSGAGDAIVRSYLGIGRLQSRQI